MTARPPAGSGRPAPLNERVLSALVAVGNLLFHSRNAVFPVVFVLVVLASEPQPVMGRASADRWMDAVGLLVAVAGQALRALVIGLAYIRRGGKDHRIYADDLVTTGFFAHARNPLYVGNLMILAGLLIVLNSTAGWLVGAPFYLIAYLAITLAEERYLRNRFGKVYDEYCARVSRFLPSFRGLRATLRGMTFQWRRVIRKEYGATFTWLMTFLVLVVWEHVVWDGVAGASQVIRAGTVAGLVLFAGYLAARILKKKKRLGSA